MPARRRTAAPSTSSVDVDTSPKPGDPLYQERRRKNNEAVQKTRQKTKVAAEGRKKRITQLRDENIELKAKIDSEKRHIDVLRKLIIQGKKNEEQDRIINEILNASDDDDDDDLTRQK